MVTSNSYIDLSEMDSQEHVGPGPTSSRLPGGTRKTFSSFHFHGNALPSPHSVVQANDTTMQRKVASLEGVLHILQTRVANMESGSAPIPLPRAQSDRLVHLEDLINRQQATITRLELTVAELQTMVIYVQSTVTTLDSQSSGATNISTQLYPGSDATQPAVDKPSLKSEPSLTLGFEDDTSDLSRRPGVAPVSMFNSTRQLRAQPNTPRLGHELRSSVFSLCSDDYQSTTNKRRRAPAAIPTDLDAEILPIKAPVDPDETLVDLTFSDADYVSDSANISDTGPRSQSASTFDFTSFLPQPKAMIQRPVKRYAAYAARPGAHHPQFLPTMVLTQGNLSQQDRTLEPLENMTTEFQKGVEFQFAESKRLEPKTVGVPGSDLKVEFWRKAGKYRVCISCHIRKAPKYCGLRREEQPDEPGHLPASRQCPHAVAHGHFTIRVEGGARNTYQPIVVLPA